MLQVSAFVDQWDHLRPVLEQADQNLTGMVEYRDCIRAAMEEMRGPPLGYDIRYESPLRRVVMQSLLYGVYGVHR